MLRNECLRYRKPLTLEMHALRLIRFVSRSSSQQIRYYTPFGSHTTGNDPETLEKGKEKVLKARNLIKNAPGWKEELASDSEAAVKADRGPDPDSLKVLQEETIDAIHSSKNDAETDAVIIERVIEEVKIRKTA
ncbi:6255_t:CDS:2 [Paraglomus brasilianum]|uniref:6255_t:CDS:1 n=1 Tax=Paraglomus brasilianum TaxID=144538 RepID=A0A9N8VXQ3_9GLOM|nr:6255_t:CDS:2 [Paraglomus brasilianum]